MVEEQIVNVADQKILKRRLLNLNTNPAMLVEPSQHWLELEDAQL
jgi:hypothetical protein